MTQIHASFFFIIMASGRWWRHTRQGRRGRVPWPLAALLPPLAPGGRPAGWAGWSLSCPAPETLRRAIGVNRTVAGGGDAWGGLVTEMFSFFCRVVFDSESNTRQLSPTTVTWMAVLLRTIRFSAIWLQNNEDYDYHDTNEEKNKTKTKQKTKNTQLWETYPNFNNNISKPCRQ